MVSGYNSNDRFGCGCNQLSLCNQLSNSCGLKLEEDIGIYPDVVYVQIFLEEGRMLNEKSPQWFLLMFQSILNIILANNGVSGQICPFIFTI